MKLQSKHNVPLIIIAALLALALVLGIIATAVILTRQAKAVFTYRGMTVDEGMYSYFALSYKGTFLTEQGYSSAYDNPVFFRQTDEKTGKTYGELFRESLDSHVKSILLASYLYDRTLTLSATDREKIQNGVDTIAKEGKKAFNEMGKSYGFDYKSLQKCAEMIYKTSKIYSMYASNTSNANSNTDACNSFYEENYANVFLLFIRTETVFCYDDSGNRLIDEETGYDATRTLTSDELAKRQADILSLREGIEAWREGKDGAITSITIADMLKVYYKDDSAERAESGYYLSAGEPYTKNLSPSLPGIVDAALALEVGDFAEVVVSAEDYKSEIEGAPFIGSCFIWRAPLSDGAYADEDFADMFSTFYSGVGQSMLLKNLEALLPEVEEGKRFALVNPVDIPYLYQYVIRF